MVLNPAIIRSSVVLPQPDGPRKVKNSPLRTSKFRLGMMTLSPNFLNASYGDVYTHSLHSSSSNADL